MHFNDFCKWNVEIFSSVFIWLMTNFKCVLGFYRLRPIKQLHSSEGKRVWSDWQVQALRPKCIVGRPVAYVKNTHTYCSLKLCWKAFSEMYSNPQYVTVLKYMNAQSLISYLKIFWNLTYLCRLLYLQILQFSVVGEVYVCDVLQVGLTLYVARGLKWKNRLKYN